MFPKLKKNISSLNKALEFMLQLASKLWPQVLPYLEVR